MLPTMQAIDKRESGRAGVGSRTVYAVGGRAGAGCPPPCVFEGGGERFRRGEEEA